MAKMNYVEPNDYFTAGMKKILDEGEKKSKGSVKKSTTKKPAQKKTSKKK